MTDEERKGRATLMLEAKDSEARRIDERDARQDARTDKAWEAALETAKDAQVRAERMVKYQWAFMALMLVAILTLAGHAVGLSIPGLGEVNTEAAE